MAIYPDSYWEHLKEGTSMDTQHKRMQEEALERLKRIETKISRGFEELGISTDSDRDWLTVDVDARVIYIASMGRSLQVVKRDAVAKGAKAGKNYDLVHKGDCVGSIYL